MTYNANKKTTAIKDFSIEPLSIETLNDFLYFFDNITFREHPDWGVCYCYSFHFVGTAAEWNNREKNRASVIDLISTGKMHGYLAYTGGTPIGWCNANDKNAFSRLKLNKELWDVQPAPTASVVCFLIAPEYRGLGVARKLLTRVCSDFSKLSYEIVEAYPDKDPISNEDNCAGPLALYKGLGFEKIKSTDESYIMQKRI
ncbi:MAG: GNAT family N-acetyltransferase [Spirochaetales bacterium]|nr:GNAT family N-acetyltransferase [Spirochaetales bacterium]